MATREQLLEILSEYEAAPPAELQRIVHLHEEQGGSLAELLLQQEVVDEEDLFFLMSRRLAVPAIPAERLRYLTLSPDIRRRVPPSLARECVLVPVDLDTINGRLSVAMFDPTDQTALDKLRRVSRVTEIRAYLARRGAILEALETVYSEDDERVSDNEELPLLGSGATAGKGAAQAAEHDSTAAKVELDPSMAMEIQAFEEVGYVAPPSVRPASPQFPGPVARTSAPPPVPAQAPRRELQARSLLHEREQTGRFVVPPDIPSDEDQTGETEVGERNVELDIAENVEPGRVRPKPEEAELGQIRSIALVEESLEPLEVLEPLENEITRVRAHPDLTRAGEAQDLDQLLSELLESGGVLVAMLEERIEPTSGSCKEYGRLSRLVARELGMDEIAVSRVSLAAYLYGLDLALKREVGSQEPVDVAQAFSHQAVAFGGLGPSLRSLGARALGLREDGPEPMGVRLIRMIVDYLELRAESDQAASDHETLVQLLRTGGGEPAIVDALARAVSSEATPRLQLNTTLSVD